MFSGIVQDIGTLTDIKKNGDWRLTIRTDRLSLSPLAIGASIACCGICLTLVAKTDYAFEVQASLETLTKTTIKNWQSGKRINLEPALRLGDELGGHLISGHIDDVIRVVSRKNEGDSLRLEFELPQELARFLAPKGSVVIDGTSLTLNEVGPTHFGVNVIPHTQKVTTLGDLKPGDEVNIEVDMIARYLDRLIPRS